MAPDAATHLSSSHSRNNITAREIQCPQHNAVCEWPQDDTTRWHTGTTRQRQSDGRASGNASDSDAISRHPALPTLVTHWQCRSRSRLLRYNSGTPTTASHTIIVLHLCSKCARAAAATDNNKNTRATVLSHCGEAMAIHDHAQRSATHQHKRSNRDMHKQRCARSHISHKETRRSNAYATTKSAIATLRHSAQVTAVETTTSLHDQDAHFTPSACSQATHDIAAEIPRFRSPGEQLTHLPLR
jgi:hypothetical protein